VEHERVTIDLDARPGGPDRPRWRVRRRWWVLAGLALLVVSFPGSTPWRPAPHPAGVPGDVPAAVVSLPPGADPAAGPWCLTYQSPGGYTLLTPCGAGAPARHR
jgi:hypothetical protein